jgi:hypothetical protein
MKSSIFLDIKPYSLLKIADISDWCLLYAGVLLGLFIPENGVYMFL